MNTLLHIATIVRRWLGTIAIFLVILTCLWIYLDHAHQSLADAPHLSNDQVRHCTEEIAATFGGSVEIVEAPVCWQHSYWIVSCHADDIVIHMIFEDATGRLWSLATEPLKATSQRLSAPLETAAEAREVSLHRLYDMQMISAGYRLQLIQPPTPSFLGASWRMLWRVAPKDGSSCYEVSLILDRRTGLPTNMHRRPYPAVPHAGT